MTSYAYDKANRKTAEVTATGTRTWTYDVAGQMTGMTDRNGRVITLEYDLAGRVRFDRWYDSATSVVPVDVVHYQYDAADNLTSISDADSKVEYIYDERNLVSQTRQFGTETLPRLTLVYTYDPSGNILSVGDPAGVTVSSTYTDRNELASRSWTIVGAGSLGLAFAYDASGRLLATERSMDGTVAGSTARTYDGVGNLTRLTHTGSGGLVFEDTRYQYDATVRLIGETRVGQSVNYGYDADWQLTAADFTGQADEAYQFDALGNRFGNVIGAHNRLLQDADFDYTYDNEGNLTQKVGRVSGEVTEYTYDHRNRLIGSERRSAGGILLSESEYKYDALGRLIERDVDGAVQKTVYDGDHAWADLNAANTVTARYLFGDQIDKILARWRPTDGFAWYLTDHQGTVRQIVNGAGTVLLNQVGYSTFGRVVSESNPTAGDRFKYTGREWSPELGLYYYRARFYDPASGRFIGQDPIGFAGGDLNWYRYVNNFVSRLTDAFGLSAASENSGTKNVAAQTSKGACRVGLWTNAIYKVVKFVYDWIRVVLASIGIATGMGAGAATTQTHLNAIQQLLNEEKRRQATQAVKEIAKICGPKTGSQ